MEEDYNMDPQDSSLNEQGNRSVDGDNLGDSLKDFGDQYDDLFEDDEGNNFRNNRGRGNFRNRGRGPPPGWMNGPPPMRFRGRGYGPAGPPMRGRAFFRVRSGPRFSNTPNFEGNWGPMGPPPPGMMGGPPPFGPPPGMMPPGGPMGPPPNMMGQPPPFGGPPGMPPPNMPAPELWVETKSEDGKPYYYHSRTRETTWNRPQDSPTCKVVTQQEMDTMSSAGPMAGMPGMGMPGMGMGMPPNGMMPQMMPPAHQPPAVPPFMTQPPPWLKDGKESMNSEDQGSGQHQMESDDSPPGEAPLSQMPPANQPPPGNFPGGPPNFANAPPSFPGGPPALGQPMSNMTNMPNMGHPMPNMPNMANMPNMSNMPQMDGDGPPGGYPGAPGAWGGWGGWPPPLVANPPPNAGNANMPDAGAAGQQMPSSNTPPVLMDQMHMDMQQHKKEITIPPELEAAAAEWTAHQAPDGRPYYYHAASQESVWQMPKPMKELSDLKAKIQAEKDRAEKIAIIKDKEIKTNLEDIKSKIQAEKDRAEKSIRKDFNQSNVIDVDTYEQKQAAAEAKAIADKERAEQEERDKVERERLEKEKAEQEKVEKEKAEKEKAEKEKEKAKADKSRPISSTPISGTPWCVVWTGDGRVFFYNPTAHSSVWERPAQLLGRQDVDRAVSHPPSALQDQQRKDAAAAGAAKAANGELKRAADSDSDDSDSEPIKKSKGDDNKKPAQIDLGKEAAIEAEVRAARERGVVPHEQRLRSFLAMLHEKQVSAFSTWEKELHKIVFDPRYLMLNSKERRQVFDQYVRERAEEERKEKKNRLLQKKLTFRTLLEEAKLHSKSSFTEFASKHGRDERFKSIEKARERELYFNEYIVEVRKKEKEDKEKKRDQAKLEYFALLKEKGVDRHARFSDLKKKIDAEPRYKAVEGGAAREDYFREYCKQLKDDRRKDKDAKERDRSNKKEKKEKDREKDKDKEGKKEKKKEKGEAQTEEVKKQPTPPPDQWAEILGIPGEEARARASKKAQEAEENKTSDEDLPSPKQLRSSKKEPPAPEVPQKSPIKSPPKKRKFEEFIPPEPEKKPKKKGEKKKATDKTEKKKKKKTEKD